MLFQVDFHPKRTVFCFTGSCGCRARVDMDEYDELFEIEDNFDDQFADELEALADLERGEE